MLNAVFPMVSVPRLQNEDHWEKLGHESEIDSRESDVGDYQSGVLSCTVRRRYQATTCEDIEDLVFVVMIL
jgi:hypothetical protein